jgi:NNP family nitrate/nitrite transporter-like MFS transporter
LAPRFIPKEDRYEFRQVAILELTYIVNFGSELAVVSMLPTFFETTFDLPKATAGILASCFAFVNLGRPALPGGLISDKVGSRKKHDGLPHRWIGSWLLGDEHDQTRYLHRAPLESS